MLTIIYASLFYKNYVINKYNIKTTEAFIL
jgi:hypothetical protein